MLGMLAFGFYMDATRKYCSGDMYICIGVLTLTALGCAAIAVVGATGSMPKRRVVVS